MTFFQELKRRNVVRMGVLYVVAGWVGLQVADVIFDQLSVPAWAFRLLLSLIVLGFPFALIFSWIFELTPEGLKRERDIDRNQSIVATTGQRMNTVIVILLVLAIGGLVADRLIPRSAAPETIASEELAAPVPANEVAVTENNNTIAVLPFVNMSGDQDNEYFSDGLSEELLNSLVRVGGLKVTGRTSSFAFKGQSQDLREVGRLLNVANVLEGSVRKAGNRVRITAQLVKVSDGYHLWSETFDRELNDIFAIQAEIAQQVTQALHVTLLGGDAVDAAETVSASQNSEAYEQYLRGTYALQRDADGLESLEKAKGHFLRAIELDERYVDAYWGMFRVWNRINRNGHVPYVEAEAEMARYDEELQKRAPGSENALSAASRTAIVQRDYATALKFSEEAARRFPGSAVALAGYAQNLLLANPSIEGSEADEALQAVDEALRLDPLSLQIMLGKANLLYRQHNCGGVEEMVSRALELDPETGRFRGLLAQCIFAHEQDLTRALVFAESEPLGFMHHTMLAILQDKLGRSDIAQQHLDAMYVAYGDSASYQYGQVHAQWGDIETALTWLETAVEIRDVGIVLSAYDPLLDPLRGEPRFQKILEAAGH